ncbi:DUF1648 domain-containing protein [Streptomyces sp. NPDC058195]|uniref:DUF1648 domain-containing protein n=1 Tax=Streptomyces sp. NPDC058195 TaxID=3346375 RepID=UPI0036E50195
MNRKNLGGALFVVLPFMLALVADLTLFLVFRDRLPERVASHFTGGGRADQYMGRDWYVLFSVLAFAVTGASWLLMAARWELYGRARQWLVASGFALAGFLGWLMAAALLANLDAATGPRGEALSVSLPMWHFAAALGAAALAGGAGMALAALRPAPEPLAGSGPGEGGPGGGGQTADGARIALTDGEVAGWARGAGSRWSLPLIVLLVVAGLAQTLLWRWDVGLPLLAAGLLLAAFARVYVVVDRRGITVSGMLRWPRVRVPLDRIESAGSRHISPFAEFGGWGYRVRPGGRGVVLRSGEGIVATLADGRKFAVTVDDSKTGAALLNTLVDRRRAGR